MAKALISYDKELPEIPGRLPWEKPTSFLVKDTAESGYRVDSSGRRPSHLLLVPKIRKAVDNWREQGYAGASEVTRRLFEYWFEEDHEVTGFQVPFRYYFCQREAIETMVWLVEIAGVRDAQKLIKSYAEVYKKLEPDGLQIGYLSDRRISRAAFPNTPISLLLEASAIAGQTPARVQNLVHEMVDQAAPKHLVTDIAVIDVGPEVSDEVVRAFVTSMP